MDREKVLRSSSTTIFTAHLFELLPTHPLVTTAKETFVVPCFSYIAHSLGWSMENMERNVVT